jgi:hypothetical protein
VAKYGLRHQPPKLGIVGSNPTEPVFVDFNEFFLVALSVIHDGATYRKLRILVKASHGSLEKLEEPESK